MPSHWELGPPAEDADNFAHLHAFQAPMVNLSQPHMTFSFFFEGLTKN